MSLLPPIGASGIYQLNAPFAALMTASTTYTCMAIRRIADIVQSGFDPYEAYYEPQGIPRSTYDLHLKADMCIVSLQSSGGKWLYVPSPYIASYPNMGGIKYTSLLLGINLGPIPSFLNLAPVKQKIIDDIRDMIGVTSTVTTVAVSETKILPQEISIALEASRQSNISDSTTDRAKYLSTLAQLNALQTKVTELENYIATHHVP